MTIGKDGSRHAGRTREVNQYEPRSRVEEIPPTLSRLSRTRPHTAVEGSWYKSDARPDGVKPCFSWNRTARLGGSVVSRVMRLPCLLRSSVSTACRSASATLFPCHSWRYSHSLRPRSPGKCDSASKECGR